MGAVTGYHGDPDAGPPVGGPPVGGPPVAGALIGSTLLGCAALLAYLAKALKLRRSDIRIVSGETARLKIVALSGDGAALAAGRVADDMAALAAQRSADDALDHDDPVEEVFEDQIACADLVVLNKCDLLDQGGMEKAQAAMAGGDRKTASGELAALTTAPSMMLSDAPRYIATSLGPRRRMARSRSSSGS